MISGARTLQTHTVSVYKGAAVWTRLGPTASGRGGGVDLGSPVVSSESSRTSDRLPQEAAPLNHSYKYHRRINSETVADPPAPPVGALPSSELTRVEGATPVCVYLSFYSHQLAGAGCMARTRYRLSPLVKQSLSANNLLGSVLGAGDAGQ